MGALDFQNTNEGLLVVAVLGLLIANQLLGFFKEWLKERWDYKKGNGPVGAIEKLRETVVNLERSIASLRHRLDGEPEYPQCFYDNQHFDRIRRIEQGVDFIQKEQNRQREQILQGDFHCKMRREHLQTIERLNDD